MSGECSRTAWAHVWKHMCVRVYTKVKRQVQECGGSIKQLKLCVRERSAGRQLTSGAAETQQWSALGWRADRCRASHLS